MHHWLKVMVDESTNHENNITCNAIQRNPVNTATNGPWKFGRINGVAVLTGLG